LICAKNILVLIVY